MLIMPLALDATRINGEKTSIAWFKIHNFHQAAEWILISN
jgi:hypothetical protein